MHRYMIVAACVMMATPVLALAHEGLPKLAELAMERVDAAGLAALVGRVIRCERDKPVGLMVQAVRGARLEHVEVSGCEIGVVIEPPVEGEAEAQLSGTAPFEVSGLKTTRTLVGVWDTGDHSLAEYNQVGGGTYGFVVAGRYGVYRHNSSLRNSADGFLITGSFNQIYANDVQFNGTGIRVGSVVPQLDKNTLVRSLRLWGRGNVIVSNTVLNNRRGDLYEFIGSDQQAPCEDNHWGILPDGQPAPNVFRTAKPSCLR